MNELNKDEKRWLKRFFFYPYYFENIALILEKKEDSIIKFTYDGWNKWWLDFP